MSLGDMTFEKVPNFKYLGVNVNEKANSNEKINRKIIARNKWYFSLVLLIMSKLLSTKIKIRPKTKNPGQAYCIII